MFVWVVFEKNKSHLRAEQKREGPVTNMKHSGHHHHHHHRRNHILAISIAKILWLILFGINVVLMVMVDCAILTNGIDSKIDDVHDSGQKLLIDPYDIVDTLNNDDDDYYYGDPGKIFNFVKSPKTVRVPMNRQSRPSTGAAVAATGNSNAQQQQQAHQCPQSDDHHILLPCTCNSSKKEILCRGGGSSTAGSAEEQLRNTFHYYAKWIPPSMQRFDSIYINLRNLTILHANLFNGIKFANILLSGSELTYIHRDAFLGTEQHVYTVFIYGTNLSSQPSTQFDFFSAIRTLTNLQKLIIYKNNLISIPERAFVYKEFAAHDEKNNSETIPNNSNGQSSSKYGNHVTEIQITAGNVRMIGTDSFAGLVHLEQLTLSKNRINLIHSYAFRMFHPSNSTLMIDLTDNDLNSTSFQPNAFIGAKRPLKIHLGLNGCNAKLDNLPEEIFRPFLEENPQNTIDVGRHCFNLQCNCRMAWTLSEKYRLRVKNFRCSNDKNHVVYFSDYMRNETCQSYFRKIKSTTAPTSSESEQEIKYNEIETLNLNQSMYRNGTLMDPLYDTKDFCTTKKCSKQGIEMNTYLNRSVDPCDSFYDFACNGWENKHLLEYLVQVLSNGGSEFDNFVKVQLKIEENFEKLLTIEPKQRVNATTKLPMSNTAFSSSFSANQNGSISSTTPTPSLTNTTAIMSATTAASALGPVSANGWLGPKILPAINTRKMYTKCIKQTNQINHDGLNKILADIGGWPLLNRKTAPMFDRDTYRWEKYYDTVVNQYTDGVFLEIESSIDEHQIKHLMIKSAGFIVSRRKLLSVKMNRLESYANYMLATALHFGATNYQNETMDEVWETIKFEKQLADIAKKSLGSEFMILRRLETLGCLIQEIDWLYIWNNIQRQHYGIINNESTLIKSKAMFDVHYLIELSRLLSRADPRIIANFIAWRVIDSVGFLIGGTGFIDIQQNFYSTESKEGLKTLKKQCLEPLLQSMPYLMARIFAEKYLPPKAKENAKQIVETVKKSFIESMKKKNWIDEPKRGLIEKVEKINMNIGYPDWILDDQNLESFYCLLNYTIPTKKNSSLALLQFYSKVQQNKILHMLANMGERINKSHFWDPLPLHVGATYDFVGHIITIPMGLLLPPFYEDDRPFYLNYASLGSFFGHEMAHSVTPRYSEFDQLLPPWNNDFLKDYLFKAQCFVSQYTGYYDKEADLHLDGTRTFEEDMSDLAGIQAAYWAYQEMAKRLMNSSLDNDKSSSSSTSTALGSASSPTTASITTTSATTSPTLTLQRIQELPEFSNDMLFFISFAQKWCRSSTHVQTRIRISKSVHSPEKYRVNGALSNLDVFAKTFNCPIGSMMNPARRCESW